MIDITVKRSTNNANYQLKCGIKKWQIFAFSKQELGLRPQKVSITSKYTTLQVKTHGSGPGFPEPQENVEIHQTSRDIQTQLIDLDVPIHLPSRKTTHYKGFPSHCHSQTVDTGTCMALYQTAQTHALHGIPLDASLTSMPILTASFPHTPSANS